MKSIDLGNEDSQSKIDVTPDGNQAREKLAGYVKDYGDFEQPEAERKADHLLAWLWTEGYVIVPIA